MVTTLEWVLIPFKQTIGRLTLLMYLCDWNCCGDQDVGMLGVCRKARSFSVALNLVFSNVAEARIAVHDVHKTCSETSNDSNAHQNQHVQSSLYKIQKSQKSWTWKWDYVAMANFNSPFYTSLEDICLSQVWHCDTSCPPGLAYRRGAGILPRSAQARLILVVQTFGLWALWEMSAMVHSNYIISNV